MMVAPPRVSEQRSGVVSGDWKGAASVGTWGWGQDQALEGWPKSWSLSTSHVSALPSVSLFHSATLQGIYQEPTGSKVSDWPSKG
jgi:hypothetical protein